MRRSDRLAGLVTRLRTGAVQRAEDLARDLGVSPRTIYRDMETLAAAGVPVAGTPGQGYRVTAAVTLPPLNLSMVEVEALQLGLNAVGQHGDAELSRAAKTLSAKLDAVMPESGGAAPAGYGFAVYPFGDATRGFQHLPMIRQAIRARQKLRVTRGARAATARPLQLDYWGRLWTCVVWDEAERRFAEWRLDQIDTVSLLPGLFVDEPGKTLADYRRGGATPERPAKD